MRSRLVCHAMVLLANCAAHVKQSNMREALNTASTAAFAQLAEGQPSD